MFSTECETFKMKVDSLKYSVFIDYLNSLNLSEIPQVYRTNDNVDVQGGVVYYIYLKNKSGAMWLYFEPESSDLINEIQKKFNMVF